jgi:hypothetical protein
MHSDLFLNFSFASASRIKAIASKILLPGTTILTWVQHCRHSCWRNICRNTRQQLLVGVEESEPSVIPGFHRQFFLWKAHFKTCFLCRGYVGPLEHLIIRYQLVILGDILIRFVKFQANSIPSRGFIRSPMKHRQIAFRARDWRHQVLSHGRGHCRGRFVLHSSKTFSSML